MIRVLSIVAATFPLPPPFPPPPPPPVSPTNTFGRAIFLGDMIEVGVRDYNI